MRAYKFLNEKYGFMALRDKRLKQSRLKDLNDPFELTPYNLAKPKVREAFLKTRLQLGEEKGITCFSSEWCDPVIWAHYSDKHKGLCLGFEIPNLTGNINVDECAHVSYIKDPLIFPDNFLTLPYTDGLAIINRILFTKFKHWEYEQEIRMWAPLQHEENGHHYLEFDQKLKLKEVIIGAYCKLSRTQIAQSLGASAGDVTITKARAAYDRFAMVVDENWD